MRMISLALALATCSAAAQEVSVGVGRITMATFDVNAPTRSLLNVGIAHLNGELFVSTRGRGRTSSPPHTMYVFDTSGNLVRSFLQDPATSSSTWGFRDGASDGSNLLFGFEGGIRAFDSIGNPVTILQAANGPQSITNPIVSTGVISTHRGVAFDPYGNGGAGSIFVSNYSAPIEEIALDGTLLTRFPNTGQQAWGIAIHNRVPFDPRPVLYINADTAEGNIVGYVVDRSARTLTANSVSIARGVSPAGPGGLDIVPGGLDGRGCGFDLVGLDQASFAADSVTGYRVELWNGLDPVDEPQLLTGVDGGTLSRTSKTFQVGTNTSFSFDLDQPGLPYVIFFNANLPALRPVGIVRGRFKSLWEFRLLTRFTNPMRTAVEINRTSGSAAAFGAPALNQLAGLTLSMQAVVLDTTYAGPVTACGGSYPVGVTDVASLSIASLMPRFRFYADGADSQNSDTSHGFWGLECNTSRAGDDIVRLVVDLSTISGMEFDTNQSGMADQFSGGNSTQPGCGGTYRNGSDVSTGLIYDAQNSTTNLCDRSANCGWIGSNVAGYGLYQTIEFRFAPGAFHGSERFEFDADTDGGPGIDGAAMNGARITIETSSGAVFVGRLSAAGAGRAQWAVQ